MRDLPEDLALREIGLGDMEEMLALVERCDQTYVEWAPPGWEPPDPGVDHDRWRENWGRPHRWARGARDRDGGLVAFVSWSQEADPDSRPVDGIAHLSALFVDPSRWRQGIAETILGMAEAAMARAGFSLARLWTPAGAPAQRFYERVGWRPDGRRSWHAPLALAVVGYEKRLAPSAAERR